VLLTRARHTSRSAGAFFLFFLEPDVQFFLFALCAGPDMEQVKKEAMHFLSGGAAQRAVVDGVKIYSEKELEQEMGETRRYNTHTHTLNE